MYSDTQTNQRKRDSEFAKHSSDRKVYRRRSSATGGSGEWWVWWNRRTRFLVSRLRWVSRLRLPTERGLDGWRRSRSWRYSNNTSPPSDSWRVSGPGQVGTRTGKESRVRVSSVAAAGDRGEAICEQAVRVGTGRGGDGGQKGPRRRADGRE